MAFRDAITNCQIKDDDVLIQNIKILHTFSKIKTAALLRLSVGAISLFFITCLVACHPSGVKKLTEKNSKWTNDSIGVRLQLLTDAVDIPVEVKASPDNTRRLFITDNKGKILLLKYDSLLPKPFFNIYDKLGIQDKNSPIGMVFSFAFDPKFSTNHKFYVCYTEPTKVEGNTCELVISQFMVSKSNADLADLKTEQKVMEVEGKNIQNNGAQIIFGPDGYLYISIGDDASGDSNYTYHAQDLSTLNGKLLRINVNKYPYVIPLDNPFVDTKNARPEIWAYGFRKLWHYDFDSATHALFGGDVGEDKEEEIDIIEKGANYGWPAMEGDSSFARNVANKSGYTAPIHSYTHKTGICVIGGSFYYGNEFPSLKNKYIFGDFNGSMFALTKNMKGTWIRQPIKMINKPADPLLISGCNVGSGDNIFVMGILNTKRGPKGVVYKIVKL